MSFGIPPLPPNSSLTNSSLADTSLGNLSTAFDPPLKDQGEWVESRLACLTTPYGPMRVQSIKPTTEGQCPRGTSTICKLATVVDSIHPFLQQGTLLARLVTHLSPQKKGEKQTLDDFLNKRWTFNHLVASGVPNLPEDYGFVIKTGKDRIPRALVYQRKYPTNLFNELNESFRQNKPFPRKEMLEITEALMTSVASMHQAGVVHRDLKPENVLLDEKKRSILTDFGYAYHQKSTTPPWLCGSPLYLAPEYAFYITQKKETRSPLTFEQLKKHDSWSLGLLFYLMYHQGHLPPGFRATVRDRDIRQINKLASLFAEKKELFTLNPTPSTPEEVIASLLTVDPEKRSNLQLALERFKAAVQEEKLPLSPKPTVS